MGKEKVDGEEKEKKEKKDKKDKKDKEDKKEKKEKKEKDGKKDSGDAKAHDLMDHRKLFKDGQRNLTPPVADATRAFYESLLEENPDSKIVIKFCVEFGVLPLDKHKKLVKLYNKLKEKGAYNVGQQIKKMMEKKEKKDADGGKEKKEKKEKDGKEKKEKKEKKEGKDEPGGD